MAAADSNLLGSLLLPRPAQSRPSPVSSLRLAGASTAGKKVDSATQELGVELSDLKNLIQKLLDSSSEQRMHVDLSSDIVAALVNDASAASQPFSAEVVVASPRRPDTASTRLISFPAFSAGVRDCLRLVSLHAKLRNLLSQLRSDSAASLPAGEVVELLRILSRSPPASSANQTSAMSLDQVRTILSDLDLEPKSFNPSKPIPTEEFLHAVVSSHLQSLLNHRRTLRAAARERSRVFLERQQRGSNDDASGGGRAAGLDPATAAIYAAAFHNNPARTAATTPFEDVETVEYS